jgi:integral membrane sensor domain MASE1
MRWALGGAGAGPLQEAAVAAGYFATGYVATGKIALVGDLLYQNLAPLYPPTGIALACLLLLGLRIWRGLVVGASALYLVSGASLLAAVTLSLGTTLAPVCAYLVLRRLRFRVELDRLRDAVALVLVGSSSMLVSGFVGVTASMLEGATTLQEFPSKWFIWWTGDAMGVLVFTPLLLLLAKARIPEDFAPYRWVEAVVLAVSILAVSVVAMTSPFNLLFIVFPFLAWAAVRFQLSGVGPCVLIVATVSLVCAMREVGPFAGKALMANLVTLQVFNASAALTGLIIAALMSERNAAYRRIENASAQLAEAVTHLTTRAGAGTHAERWASERRVKRGNATR